MPKARKYSGAQPALHIPHAKRCGNDMVGKPQDSGSGGRVQLGVQIHGAAQVAFG